MPRPSKPWYRAASKTWVSRVGGKLRTLAHGKAGRKEAARKLVDLLAQSAAGEGKGESLTIGHLLHEYAQWFEANRPGVCYERNALILGYFEAAVKKGTKAADVRGLDVLRWVDNPRWGPVTRRLSVDVVFACFKWGVSAGLLRSNPLEGMPRPGGKKRRERIPTADDVSRFLSAANPDLRDIAECLAVTGARPGEFVSLSRLQVKGNGLIILEKHKTAGKVHRPRTIYLPPKAEEILRRRAEGKGPSALVFTNTSGRAWTRNSLSMAWRRTCDRAGVPRFCAYSLRHFRATEWLRLGVPIAHVSELLGHTSTAMVSRYYSHLARHDEELRRSAAVE